MPSLKNAQMSIPGGFKFHVAATNWDPLPFSSLDSIAQQLVQHRQGRPDLVAKYSWSLDLATVRQEVECYNIALCVQNGWSDYLIGGSESAVPFPQSSPGLLQKVKHVVGGADVLVDWIQEGQPTVTQEVATRRALICSVCPKNGKGGLEAYFTVPVSNAIRRELERKRDMKLETEVDDNLGVCDACLCPLTLKVWLALSSILPKLKPEVREKLDPSCWITKPE